jgi:hypothetical protein
MEEESINDSIELESTLQLWTKTSKEIEKIIKEKKDGIENLKRKAEEIEKLKKENEELKKKNIDLEISNKRLKKVGILYQKYHHSRDEIDRNYYNTTVSWVKELNKIKETSKKKLIEIVENNEVEDNELHEGIIGELIDTSITTTATVINDLQNEIQISRNDINITNNVNMENDGSDHNNDSETETESEGIEENNNDDSENETQSEEIEENNKRVYVPLKKRIFQADILRKVLIDMGYLDKMSLCFDKKEIRYKAVYRRLRKHGSLKEYKDKILPELLKKYELELNSLTL